MKSTMTMMKAPLVDVMGLDLTAPFIVKERIGSVTHDAFLYDDPR